MIKPDQIEGKAELFIDFEDRSHHLRYPHSLSLLPGSLSWEELERMIQAVTGWTPARGPPIKGGGGLDAGPPIQHPGRAQARG